MQKLTLDEFLMLMDPLVHDAIKELAARDGVTHLVLCENPDLTSSQFGARTAVSVGPGCTYKTPEEMEGRWLNDLPSQRQYATAYTETGGE